MPHGGQPESHLGAEARIDRRSGGLTCDMHGMHALGQDWLSQGGLGAFGPVRAAVLGMGLASVLPAVGQSYCEVDGTAWRSSVKAKCCC
jgi:hypothetical protein